MFVDTDYRSSGELEQNWWKEHSTQRAKREELRLLPGYS